MTSAVKAASQPVTPGKLSILFLGGDPWDAIWARAQALATALAAHGHTVVYVEPPSFRLGLER